MRLFNKYLQGTDYVQELFIAVSKVDNKDSLFKELSFQKGERK